MKTIFTFCLFFQFATVGIISAQCTSTATNYDLVVSTTVSIPPISSVAYMSELVCSTGHLYDSASCCTRFIHVEGGGVYEAGPLAYGIVFVKSGGTFDAHGNTNFFGLSYEAGAIILNYSGPQNLCTSVNFDTTACHPTSVQNLASTTPSFVYPDPCNDVLTFESGVANGGALLIVYDVTGKMVLEYSFTQSEKNLVDISSLAPGLYSYTITGNKTSDSFGKFALVR